MASLGGGKGKGWRSTDPSGQDLAKPTEQGFLLAPIELSQSIFRSGKASLPFVRYHLSVLYTYKVRCRNIDPR